MLEAYYKDIKAGDNDKIFYMKQGIANAGATFALFHGLAPYVDKIKAGKIMDSVVQF